MCLDGIFSKVLKEANTNVYNGDDPDSPAAWKYKDISPTNNGRIFLEDKFNKFEWDQNKSNQNIVNHGSGKGFSFYFARYGYRDNFSYMDSSLSKEGHSGILTQVYFEFLKKFIDISQLPKKLSPENGLLLLIDEIKDDSTITIISAHYTKKKNHIDIYTENYLKLYLDSDKRFQENSNLIKNAIRKKLTIKIKKSLIDGYNEFEELIKSL